MLTRRFLGAAISLALPTVVQAAEAAPRPNIIYILADDLGYADIGCYGQTKVRTPNIDRLANQGMRFTNLYATPCCAPSRCVLLTGKHLGHARVRDNGSPAVQKLAADDVTFARVLQGAGYETACIGKWGLGYFNDSGNPLAHGFDHFLGYLSQSEAHFHYPKQLDRDGERITITENADGKQGAYAPDLFSADATSFISRPHDKPFMLYLAYTPPHAELLVPEDSLEEYAGKWPEKPFKKKRYSAQAQPRAARAAMITRMDRDIGTLMEKLKELDLEKNTLVIFTSDNGPATAGGADPAFFRSTGDLTGLKFTLAEGGIRVPFIARWPGRIAAGTSSDLVAGFEDMFPTLVEMAGAQTPARLDGVSLVPTLTGRPAEQRKRDYLYFEFQGGQAVRFGDMKAWRNAPDQPIRLYDLKADPGELTDLAEQHPDLVKRAEKLIAAAHVDSPEFPLSKPTAAGE